MKINPSVKFSLIVIAAGSIAYGAYWGYGEYMTRNFELTEVEPGRLTFLAVDTSAGFTIRVANSVAQLVQGERGEFAADTETDPEAKRIPIKEILGSMKGNEDDLAVLVKSLNKIAADEFHPDDVVWTEEDIEKALNGDNALREKLELDLNCKLDGTPGDQIKMKTLLNGLWIDVPIPIAWESDGTQKSHVARVKVHVHPKFAEEVANRINKEFEPSQAKIIGNFQDIARSYEREPGKKEDLRAKLMLITSNSRKESLARTPERILQASRVLLNGDMVTGASSSDYQDDKGRKFYRLHFKLSEEGKMRLWKYSRNTEGFSLLVVVDGVAIAAPKIGSELMSNEVIVTGLRDKRLVDFALNTLNEITQKNSK
ncbi:hypothetical protein QPK87_27975 [Kamptonema cortianum]|nr:hypothetical protein [Geitlerinema splendidum]MDK3160366.1 hypothetical protein [Kamptonema cortianum]